MTKKDLEKLLRDHNVPLYKWGKKGKRDIDRLLMDINLNEVHIREMENRIELHIKQVIIQVRQINRDKGRPKKLKRIVPYTKDVKEVAEKSLRHDLKIHTETLEFLGPKEKTKKSRYYPGLIAKRKIYLYKVIVHD